MYKLRNRYLNSKVKESLIDFPNIILKNEENLLTQNEQVFEAVSILLTVLTVRLTAQKWPEACLERPVHFECIRYTKLHFYLLNTRF